MRVKKRGDIDADYHAIRARLKSLGTTTVVAPTTIPPHTHSADQIGMQENVTRDGYLAADDVQEGLEELDSEKLARSGVQTMLGNLDMNDNELLNVWNLSMTGTVGDAIINLVRTITMTGVGLIENARTLEFTGSIVGEGLINAARTIHMDGDHVEGEALIDGLERVVFNNEPTASSIEGPSRIEMNVGVEAGVSYTAAEGIASWDNLEDTMVVYVQSGAVLIAIAVGWAVKLGYGMTIPQ